MVDQTMSHAGTVALVGLPNAGKSSLLNRFLDTKLSIVTPRAQTTRQRVVGIDTADAVQMVFLDTPGLVRPAYLLHRSLRAIAEAALAEADVVVLVVDATRGVQDLPPEVVEVLRSRGDAVVVAVNKSDLAAETERNAVVGWAREQLGAAAVEVSAETGAGLGVLRSRIAERLPESPFLYPEDELSSQNLRFFASELIRETVFELYSEEVPYAVAVRLEEFRESGTPVVIRATVLVERPSQKGIVIGKRGAAIRELGTRARAKIEALLDAPVFLELWVKVLPNWRKSALELERLGFPIPEESD